MTKPLVVTFLACALAPICLPGSAFLIGFLLKFTGIAQ